MEGRKTLTVVSCVLAVHILCATALNQGSGGTCVMDVTLVDLDGPHYNLHDICRAAGDKVTVVIRCTSGSRYSSQANVNPCLSEGSPVSLQYEVTASISDVTLLLWLNVPHDVLDSAMHTFTPVPYDVFTTHIVKGDISHTRFHLAVAQRCTTVTDAATDAYKTNDDDVKPPNVSISKDSKSYSTEAVSTTPPNHRGQIASVLTNRHRRETDLFKQPAVPDQNTHTSALNDSSGGSAVSDGKADFPKEKAEAKQGPQGKVENTDASNNLILDTVTEEAVTKVEEVMSSGDGGPETEATLVSDITTDSNSFERHSSQTVTQYITEENTAAENQETVGPDSRFSTRDRNSVVVSVSGPERPTDAELPMALVSSSLNADDLQTTSQPDSPVSRVEKDKGHQELDTEGPASSPDTSMFYNPPASSSQSVAPTARVSRSTNSSPTHSSGPLITASASNPASTFLRADDLFRDFYTPPDSHSTGGNGHLAVSSGSASTNSPSTGPPAGYSNVPQDDYPVYYDDVGSYNGPDDNNFVVEEVYETDEPFQGNTETASPDFEDVADLEENSETYYAENDLTDSTVSDIRNVTTENGDSLSNTVAVDTTISTDSAVFEVPQAENVSRNENMTNRDGSQGSLPRASGRSLSGDEPSASSSTTERPAGVEDSGKKDTNSTDSASTLEPEHSTTEAQTTDITTTGTDIETTEETDTTPAEITHTTNIFHVDAKPSPSSTTTTEPSSISGDKEETTTVPETNIPLPTNSPIDNAENENNEKIDTTTTMATLAVDSSDSTNTDTSTSSRASSSTLSTTSWLSPSSASSSLPSSSVSTTPSSPPDANFTSPEDLPNTTIPSGSRGNSSGLALPPDDEAPESDTFWPIVAALVIGIPSIIVFGIAITVIHKRRLASPARLRAASMYPSL